MICTRCNKDDITVKEYKVYSCFNGWINMVLCLECFMLWGD